MKISKVAVGSSLVVLVGAAGLASGQTVEAKFLGTGVGDNVKVTTGSGSSNLFAGQLRYQLQNPLAAPPELTGNRNTFCIDLGQFVSGSFQVYSYLDGSSVFTADPVFNDRIRSAAWMFSRYGGAAVTSTSTVETAAMQLALWEILTDYNPNLPGKGLDITSGNFSASKTSGSSLSSALVTQVNVLLNDAAPGVGMPSNVAFLSNGTYQDQITIVPAPAAGVLAGAGILGYGLRRRR